MRVPLELKLTLGGHICYINFSVIFDQNYGAYEYDWIVNKVTSENQRISFDHMDVRWKAAIENAIEERLYGFNFEDFARHWR